MDVFGLRTGYVTARSPRRAKRLKVHCVALGGARHAQSQGMAQITV